MAWNALAQLLNPKSDKALGSGLAGQAARSLGSSDAYNQYVIDANLQGQVPLSRDEWLKSQRNG